MDGIEEFLNPYKSKMRKRKDQEEEKFGQLSDSEKLNQPRNSMNES